MESELAMAQRIRECRRVASEELTGGTEHASALFGEGEPCNNPARGLQRSAPLP